MKKVSQPKKVKITGFNLLGEEIEYTFELMSADVGIPLFHENMLGIAGFCQQIKDYLNAEASDRDVAVIAMTCHQCFQVKKLIELRDKLLKNVKAVDPLDMYAALYHALQANYGATLTPLLDALSKQGDTSPAQAEALAE